MMLRRSCSFLLFALALASGAAGKDNSFPLYIGTYTQKGGKGIYLARFDSTAGKLSTPILAGEITDPSFLALHPSKPLLYAVDESGGAVSAFSIAPSTGILTLINHQSTTGNGPCHLALDATGRMLVAANYGGGSIASFPIDASGRIGPQAAFIQFKGKGPNAKRQEGPHAHSVVFSPDNRFVLIDDLGTDRTMIYSVDPKTAALQPAPQPFAAADPGAGPRHLAFSHDGRSIYVLNEIQSSVTRFAFDPGSGGMHKLETVSALPAGFKGSSTAAEIALNSAGTVLYTSNRGNDTIAVFSVDPKGALHLQQNAPVKGKDPRSFTLDPTGKWLLAANQSSDSITLFSVDPKSGQLKSVPAATALSMPVCLLFPTTKN